MFSKGYAKNWLREIFIIDSFLKTNPWTYKLRNLNREKNRKLLWKRIVAECIINEVFSEPDSHIRDKVKVVFDLSNYPNKKELERATDIDTSDITAKKDVIPLKAEVE